MAQVTLAQQYIPMYDQACVKWSNWVETETIPIIDKEPVDGGDIQRRIKELMHDMEMHNEYYDEEYIEDEDFDVEDLSKKTIH